MDSPLDDFPSEPTATIHQFAPIVEPQPRIRRSKKRQRIKSAALAPIRFVRAASIRASAKIAGAATEGLELLHRLPARIRMRGSTLEATPSLDEQIPHIAHDAGLPQDVAVPKRETSRLTTHDHHDTSARMMAIAVSAALIAGVTFGIMWQRPWIVEPAVAVSQAAVSVKTASPADAIPAASEPPLTPASPAVDQTATGSRVPVRVRRPPITPRDVRRAVIAPARIGQLQIGGQLQIETEPPGARVTVDGVGRGVTPVTIRHLPPGTKRVRVTKDGYAAAERVVSFGQNEAGHTVRIPLQRQ